LRSRSNDRVVTYVITQNCCSDATCVTVCPVQCIRPRPGDPDFTSAEQLYIDPQTCVDCGACLDACPVEAVHVDYELPENLSNYLQINADYFGPDNQIVEEPLVRRPRRHLPEERDRIRVAIVGAGAAGCYAAELLSDIAGVTVNVFDELPTPGGLVRSGVAPDHEGTKRMGEYFHSILGRRNVVCNFNVRVGDDISLDELREYHDALILAYGAGGHRELGLENESAPGSLAARDFVAWYNGHPSFTSQEVDLSSECAVVIGTGNVALDVARILASPAERFASTDIADHAIGALAASQVRQVVVVGRRDPEYAACSSSELQALTNVDGLQVLARPDEIVAGDAVQDPSTARKLELLTQVAGIEPAHTGRTVTLRFGWTPTTIGIDESGCVESVRFERPDGQELVIDTRLVLRAIGYRGLPLTGVPFDTRRGVLANVGGRVVDESGAAVPGTYCVGWIKRGATGSIGTNRACADETIDKLLTDLEQGMLPAPLLPPETLDELLASRFPDLVDFQGWQRIDREEKARGKASRRPRCKLVQIQELVSVSKAD
jgi:ferredoxin--NADP+ reductase